MVDVPSMPLKISFDDGVVSLGSCFADAMGVRLEQGGFRVERNPFGTLYNPASVAAALDRLVADREIVEEDLVQHESLWHSWHHHGAFSRPTSAETLEACNDRIHQAHRSLAEAKVLLVTFGTAWIYEHEGRVVANCHKLPPQRFHRRRLSVEEIAAVWQPLLQTLSAFNPDLSIVFTVSPIRHLADGAHDNQLSKSTLLLAVDRLLATAADGEGRQGARVYFPAYEIVLDELRDYRFYGADLSHPSPVAEDIVYERFQQAAMSPATIQQAHNNTKLARRLLHRPLH